MPTLFVSQIVGYGHGRSFLESLSSVVLHLSSKNVHLSHRVNPIHIAVVAVAVVYLHDITTYINIREISQMNHANKDLKEVKNL